MKVCHVGPERTTYVIPRPVQVWRVDDGERYLVDTPHHVSSRIQQEYQEDSFVTVLVTTASRYKLVHPPTLRDATVKELQLLRDTFAQR